MLHHVPVRRDPFHDLGLFVDDLVTDPDQAGTAAPTLDCDDVGHRCRPCLHRGELLIRQALDHVVVALRVEPQPIGERVFHRRAQRAECRRIASPIGVVQGTGEMSSQMPSPVGELTVLQPERRALDRPQRLPQGADQCDGFTSRRSELRVLVIERHSGGVDRTHTAVCTGTAPALQRSPWSSHRLAAEATCPTYSGLLHRGSATGRTAATCRSVRVALASSRSFVRVVRCTTTRREVGPNAIRR
jgi:hypothetical protein